MDTLSGNVIFVGLAIFFVIAFFGGRAAYKKWKKSPPDILGKK